MRDLICLPFAGGGTAFFHPWTVQPPRGIKIHPICLPGREARIREVPFTRMAPLLDWLDAQLAPTLHRPHILFGHSMGGAICYALCLRRMERDLPLPQALVVSACLPPPIQRPVMMHKLDKPALLDRLRSYDPANLAFDTYPELWDLMEPVLRADFSVVETFDPSETPPLPIPVISLSGRDDPLVPATEMARWSDRGRGFQHHFFDGGHFFLRDAPAEVLHSVARSVLELTGR
ncbi:thioesterase II family protein [Puniceibacterium sediminis]|uniref:Surfactin synthase thioesterase subunit n=1 Tax=Puniceibacterium sediminis TaxID=1608407 RepID=A0A238ZAX9_9RHOB|nr:alpha/beta fold hydrolase [Puniceibacterium sediminis]SNR80232.1 Surfactin synthase thioesterase subunit [Puniceibacterium sediminis]